MGNINLMAFSKNLIIIFPIAIIFFGCIGSTGHNESINEKYSLLTVDIKEDMAVVYTDPKNYQFTIVPATVFAMGSDKDFIIVKQHPKQFPKAPDKSVINFYIISLKDNLNKAIGPLTETEFNIKRQELKVSNSLVFTKSFEDLK